MNSVEQLKESGRIIFECISGSHAYGLSTPQSDIDIRGFYVNPYTEYLGLTDPVEQVSNTTNDITYYSLRKGFELLMTANPNMIELLWMPKDCVRLQAPLMDKLIENRDLFITKKCFHTHSGYAYAQIQRARGQNKKVHNPQPETMPKKEDFCYVIRSNHFMGVRHADISSAIFPMRPMPMNENWIDLNHFHAAGLEHVADTYRLYYYGEQAKGVFRGDDMLVCESIPIGDEWDRFYGLLIYNRHEYERTCKEWHSYWDWMKNRNEHRWIDQEKGKLNYDQKNMMHCMRLLMSGENILLNGFPLVRFYGDHRDYLMKIRAGEFQYEEIMAEVENRMVKLEELHKTSSIPHSANVQKIDKLYRELIGA